MHFEERDQLHSLNIFEVIEAEKCSYFNTRKIHFLNSFKQSTCSEDGNTDGTCTGALLSQFSINPGNIELENISLSQIRRLRTVW